LLVIRADAARGKLPLSASVRSKTVTEGWAEFIETCRDKKSFKDYLRWQRFWERQIGSVQITKLTPGRIQTVLVKKFQHLTPATRNRALSHISGFLTWAQGEGYLQTDPLARIKKLPENNERERYLEPQEEARLLMALDPRVVDLVKLALLTGCRRGELLALKWPDIDLRKRELRVREAKSGTGRTIPLIDEACALLRGMPSRFHGSYVFRGKDREGSRPISTERAAKMFRQGVSESGIEDFHFHDLRHTFASRLVQRGVPLYTVAKILGHSDTRVTRRYAHLTETETRAAMETLAK
ncbi:MAG: site-specific integrase, partial [Candidatus Binatia bacterium]|nr:site-specific integrase [Candidatus Binatia bacterium]